MWLWNKKDGGPESRVKCWGFESKKFFSIMLLRFGEGSREAYHTHAFNSWSWILRGGLLEDEKHCLLLKHSFSFKPIITKRKTFHKVSGIGKATWLITFRGPWNMRWHELNQHGLQTLTHGRIVLNNQDKDNGFISTKG